ncbi:MAG: hypothetical protein H6732_19165 [Alphaproteobacteria bacterium]|nr:hypothetical protein [Alphaproteobacteria bacterium]
MSEQKTTDVQTEDLTFDVRLVPHSLRRSRLTNEALDAHLDALPDEAAEGVECEVKFSTPYASRVKAEREAGRRRR